MASRKKQKVGAPAAGVGQPPSAVRTQAGAPGPHSPRWQTLGALALLAVAGLCAYANSFAVPFIFDDRIYTTNNPAIGELWRPWLVLPPRPMLGFTLALNHRISGFDVWSYHALNLVIHVLAGWTLFGLLRRTLRSEALAAHFGKHATGLSLAIALIWLVHPLQTQAVTYVIQRGESLMGLFYLLTLYCAVRAAGVAQPPSAVRTQAGAPGPHSPWWWLGAAVAFALGLATKPVIATAPVMVVLYYWVFHRTGPGLAPERQGTRKKEQGTSLGEVTTATSARGSASSAFRQSPVPSPQAPSPKPQVPGSWKWCVFAMVGLLWVGLGAWLVAASAHATAGFGMEGVTPWSYAWTQAEVLLHYLRLAVWPAGLCLDYVWQPARLAAVAPALAAVAVWLGLTLWALARRHPAGFASAWAFVILAPTSSFMPIADLAEEHRMYLPLAGIAAALALAAFGVGERLLRATVGPRLQRAAAVVGVAALTILLAALTHLRNHDYRSEEAIWRDTVEKRPDNPRAHCNLGAVYTDMGRTDEGAAECREALRLKQDYPEAQYNLGTALHHGGRPAEALEHYRAAVRYKKDYADAQYNLGTALQALGRHAEALALLQEAVRLRSNDAKSQNNLGNALIAVGRIEEGLEHHRKFLALSPNSADAHYNVALGLAKLNRVAEALAYYESALRLAPKDAVTHFELGNALTRLGRVAEGRTQYGEAVRCDPGLAEAQFALGLAAFRAGDLAEAQAHLGAACRLKPDWGAARHEWERLQQELARRQAPP